MPVTKQCGAISVAVGSHALPVGPIVNLSTGVAEGKSSFDPKAFTNSCLEMNAGDCVIFTPTLYHMSHPNLSEKRRSAWSSVWCNGDTQWDVNRVPTHPRSKQVKHGDKLGQFVER